MSGAIVMLCWLLGIGCVLLVVFVLLLIAADGDTDRPGELP